MSVSCPLRSHASMTGIRGPKCPAPWVDAKRTRTPATVSLGGAPFRSVGAREISSVRAAFAVYVGFVVVGLVLAIVVAVASG